MKQLSILTLGVILIATSCQKSSIAPSSDALQASTNEASSAKKSNFALLTSHKWLYVKYYLNYIDSANKGQLVYRRGHDNNTIDLNRNRVTFNTDGTVDEIDQYGNYIPGTWHFTNKEQTAYVVTNSYGDYYTQIDFLSCSKFEWTDANVHTHGIMAPAK